MWDVAFLMFDFRVALSVTLSAARLGLVRGLRHGLRGACTWPVTRFGPGMVYTGFCLRVAVRHPTPPGQECSKGKWPLPGAWRFSYIFLPFLHTVEPMSYSQ